MHLLWYRFINTDFKCKKPEARNKKLEMVKNFTHVYSSPLLLLLHDLSGVLLIDSLYEGNVVHIPSIRVLKLTHYQLERERERESKNRQLHL